MSCAVELLRVSSNVKVITLLEQEFNVLALPDLPIIDSSGMECRDLYGSWLGCSQDQDASDCLSALSNVGITRADWIVVDHYGLDQDWQQLVLQGLSVNCATPKLLVIDDLADRSHLADLLPDQNFFGTNTLERYEGLVPDTCLQLLGPHYALLNDEYSHLHHLVPFRSHLKRILIFFGGVDSHNLTARTVKALTDPVFSDLIVDVVIGRHSPHRHEVEELVACRPLTNLYDNLPSLAGLIARADLSIGAGGVTTWERACLGLPSLVIPIASNQAPFVRALEQAGYIQYLCQPDNLSITVIRAE